MAITMAHLVYDIIEIASSGSLPNDFKITTTQVQYWIEETRAQLITRALNKRDDINDSWIQYIGCVELEQIEDSTCCLVGSDCHILRSKQRLPSTIDTWKDNLIISVTTIEGESIPKSNPIKQRYQQYNKYTKSSKSWYLKDNYLYIINDQVLTYVSISGLFETPSDLSRFVECSGEPCWTIDSNYPVTLNLATEITDIILKTKVNPFITYPADNANDMQNITPKQEIDNKNAGI